MNRIRFPTCIKFDDIIFFPDLKIVFYRITAGRLFQIKKRSFLTGFAVLGSDFKNILQTDPIQNFLKAHAASLMNSFISDIIQAQDLLQNNPKFVDMIGDLENPLLFFIGDIFVEEKERRKHIGTKITQRVVETFNPSKYSLLSHYLTSSKPYKNSTSIGVALVRKTDDLALSFWKSLETIGFQKTEFGLSFLSAWILIRKYYKWHQI